MDFEIRMIRGIAYKRTILFLRRHCTGGRDPPSLALCGRAHIFVDILLDVATPLLAPNGEAVDTLWDFLRVQCLHKHGIFSFTLCQRGGGVPGHL